MNKMDESGVGQRGLPAVNEQQHQQQSPAPVDTLQQRDGKTSAVGREHVEVEVSNKGVQVEIVESDFREKEALLLEKASAADTLREEVEGLKCSLEASERFGVYT